MNLISCDKCGVVLDKDKLVFTESDYFDLSVDKDLFAWSSNLCEMVPCVSCPVCGNEILKEDNDEENN